MPRPIEMHAHDPRRFVSDMLAWVHQVEPYFCFEAATKPFVSEKVCEPDKNSPAILQRGRLADASVCWYSCG